MLFQLLLTEPLAFILVAAALIISITIHEFAHAWTADRLGDPTPRYQGRVTLNPAAHLDPLGTLAILFVGFGWGKPVMFDPYNLKEPVRDAAIVALAGPVSNIILAILLSLLLHLPLPIPPEILFAFVTTSVFINVMLAIFNLIPVHPLDGSKIAMALLPKQAAYEYDELMQKYGTIILIALIFPWSGSSFASRLISPIITFIVELLL